MIDQSILRAQQNRESSTEKQRQSCFVQMMNKIYEAKITKKDKPFIHGMYQNYHQKFCNKFKGIYMEHAREAFASKESIISSKSQSQFSSKNSSILKVFQEDKKNSSSEIRDNEIKKINFSSELRNQIIPNEMKKKNALKEPQFAYNVKLQQKKRQVDPPQIIVAQMLLQPSKDKLKSSISNQMNRSQQRLQPTQQSKPIQGIKLLRQMIKLKEEKLQMNEQPKLFNQNQKKESIKNKKQSQEQYEEVEQQDNSPSFYDLKRKLQQIDEPNKHVTRSQIVTSSNNSQALKTQELKVNSHIIQKDQNQRQQQELKKQIKNEQRLIQENTKIQAQEDKLQLQLPIQQKVDIIKVQNELHQDFYEKIQKSQLQNQLILQEQNAQVKKNEEQQLIRSSNEKYSKIKSEENKQKFNEQNSILTESLVQNSQVQIDSPQQIEQDQFSMSLQSSLINTLQQNIIQATNIQKNSLIINENKESQGNNSQKKISLASVQIQMPFIETEAKTEPQRIEVPIEKLTTVSSLCNSQNGLFDDYESRVEKLIAGLVQQIDKKIKPCEKCAPLAKQQSQSQKNSSDDDS